jgi:hypothetical protein
MCFVPCNCALKIQESIWDSNFHNGSSLGSVRIHSLTFFALPRACDVTLGPPSWPATLQPLALVTSPSLGLQHNYKSSNNSNSIWKHKDQMQDIKRIFPNH